MKQIVLMGNPNCGKTTLFNAITGDSQQVGNWPGVTIEKKSGQFNLSDEWFNLIDLPGIYSLTPSDSSSQDALIAIGVLAQHDIDVIINVVDACHLERHLYLTSQLLELGKPLILVINMIDIATLRGIVIDANKLSAQLQCPVILLQANTGLGIDPLKQAVLAPISASIPMALDFPDSVISALTHLEQQLISTGQDAARVFFAARRALEGDTLLEEPNADVLMADARYQAIHQVVQTVQKKKSDASEHITAKIDRIVLHRFWALPIFFTMMYLMFLLAINVGGAFQDFFDISTEALFVRGTTAILQSIHAPDWLIALGAQGIGKGINTTLTFIPVMASMYFFLACLEASGYMARAAFVVDKVMRVLGLPGKSFVPMIVGFGCNVPAIMAARTLDSERDRLLTVLMSPFMSCSARLAIYAVFVAAFFPEGGQNIVFSLYLIGILMAVFTGFILRKTLLKGSSSPLILELPAYHRPSLRRLLKDTLRRLRFFIVRAGRFIVPVCIIIGGLNAISYSEGESVLSIVGHALTPLFSPMGLHEDNWPATVGLLTGTLAKEVVVGTLNSLYAQVGHFSSVPSAPFELWTSLYQALCSIPENLGQLVHSLLHPLLSNASADEMTPSVYGVMYQHFDGKVGAYAYLLFILLYVPCVSTMAAIRQEASRRLMWFSIIWSLVVAYSTAVSFYQLATISQHPQQTLEYILAVLLGVALTLIMIRVMTQWSGARHAAANS